MLAAIGGYLAAYNAQTQRLEFTPSIREANCERKLTELNIKLTKLTETYNNALEKKENLEVIIKLNHDRLQDCYNLVDGLRYSEIKHENDVNQLEKKNKELKKKLAEYEELITAQTKGQKQKNHHSHDEV